MIVRKISDASITISLFKYFCGFWSHWAQALKYVYQDSRTYKLIQQFWGRIKIYFRYSFLGRISEIEQTTPLALTVLDNSQTVQYIVGFYKKWKNRVIGYFSTSSTLALAKDIKGEPKFFPLVSMGVIAVTVVIVNVLLCLVSGKQIGLWGWLMRGLFLFAGISGLFCKVGWPRVKQGSIFLRKLGAN